MDREGGAIILGWGRYKEILDNYVNWGEGGGIARSELTWINITNHISQLILKSCSWSHSGYKAISISMVIIARLHVLCRVFFQ